MFCHQCGKPLPTGANFCPACGAPASANVFAASPLSTMYRPRLNRMIAGVCAAIAIRFGWDLTATRIVAVIFGVLIFPILEIAYLVAWLLIPEEVPIMSPPFVPPPQAPQPPTNPQPY